MFRDFASKVQHFSRRRHPIHGTETARTGMQEGVH